MSAFGEEVSVSSPGDIPSFIRGKTPVSYLLDRDIRVENRPIRVGDETEAGFFSGVSALNSLLFLYSDNGMNNGGAVSVGTRSILRFGGNDCVRFTGNRAGGVGGALAVGEESQLLLSGNNRLEFSENEAASGAATADGAGTMVKLEENVAVVSPAIERIPAEERSVWERAILVHQ